MLLQGENVLLQACRERQFEDLMRCIRLGYNVNCRGNRGLTPLMYTAISNFGDGTKALIDNDAIISQKDDIGFTALKYAEQNNSEEVLAILNSDMVLNIQLAQMDEPQDATQQEALLTRPILPQLLTQEYEPTNFEERLRLRSRNNDYDTEYSRNFSRAAQGTLNERNQRLAAINEEAMNQLQVLTSRGNRLSGSTYLQNLRDTIREQRADSDIDTRIENVRNEVRNLDRDVEALFHLQDGSGGETNEARPRQRSLSNGSDQYTGRRVTFPDLVNRYVDHSDRSEAIDQAIDQSISQITQEPTFSPRPRSDDNNVSSQQRLISRGQSRSSRRQQGNRSNRPAWNSSTTIDLPQLSAPLQRFSVPSGPNPTQSQSRYRVQYRPSDHGVTSESRPDDNMHTVTYETEEDYLSPNSSQNSFQRHLQSVEQGQQHDGNSNLSWNPRRQGRRPNATPFPQIQQVQMYDQNYNNNSNSSDRYDGNSVSQFGSATSTNPGGGMWFITSKETDQKLSRLNFRGSGFQLLDSGRQGNNSGSSGNRGTRSNANVNSEFERAQNTEAERLRNVFRRTNNEQPRQNHSQARRSCSQVQPVVRRHVNFNSESMGNNNNNESPEHSLTTSLEAHQGDISNNNSTAHNHVNNDDQINVSSQVEVPGNHNQSEEPFSISRSTSNNNEANQAGSIIGSLASLGRRNSLSRSTSEVVNLQNRIQNYLNRLDNTGGYTNPPDDVNDVSVGGSFDVSTNTLGQNNRESSTQTPLQTYSSRTTQGVQTGVSLQEQASTSTDTSDLTLGHRRDICTQINVDSRDTGVQGGQACQGASTQTEPQQGLAQSSSYTQTTNTDGTMRQPLTEQNVNGTQSEEVDVNQLAIVLAQQMSLEESYQKKATKYDAQIAEQMQTFAYMQDLEDLL